MRQPSWRRASTRSPMGRSCMRATPETSKSPPRRARAAVRGRMAVPALPRKRRLAGGRPSPPPPPRGGEGVRPGVGLLPLPLAGEGWGEGRGIPVTSMLVAPRCTTLHPNARSASSITLVSSESSRSWMTVTPSDNAASSSTRLEMLLDPGRTTVPAASSSGGRSRNAVANMLRPAGRPPLFRLLAHAPVRAHQARLGDHFFQLLAVAFFRHLQHVHHAALEDLGLFHQ